jgi:hypothetical protein
VIYYLVKINCANFCFNFFFSSDVCIVWKDLGVASGGEDVVELALEYLEQSET